MNVTDLSIDPRGVWSHAKARRVLEIINPEAAAHNLKFRMIDVTTLSDGAPRCILTPYCTMHDYALDVGQVCPACARTKERRQ